MQIKIETSDKKSTVVNLINPVISKDRRKVIYRNNEIVNEELKHERILIQDSENDDRQLINSLDIEKNIIKDDLDIDFNKLGKKIDSTKRIIIDQSNKPVFDFKVKLQRIRKEIKGTEVISITDEQDYIQTIANVNSDLPIQITDKLVSIEEALMNNVIAKSYYITHVDGLTFEYLFNIAKKLEDGKKLAIVVANINKEGKKVNVPIIVKDGGLPYAFGLLEGQTSNDEYLLRLHLIDFPTKKIVEESKIKIGIEPALILKLNFKGGVF